MTLDAYRRDRAWSDQFIPEIKRIVGPLLLVESPLEIDRKQAADLIIFKARDLTIAARVRRPGFAERYPSEITIRCHRDNGMTTELEKIVNGFADWMVYAHASGEVVGKFSRYFVVDLDHWRAHMLRDGQKNRPSIKWGKRSNGDGTYFTWYDLKSFPPQPPILVASSHPLYPVIGNGGDIMEAPYTEKWWRGQVL